MPTPLPDTPRPPKSRSRLKAAVGGLILAGLIVGGSASVFAASPEPTATDSPAATTEAANQAATEAATEAATDDPAATTEAATEAATRDDCPNKDGATDTDTGTDSSS